MTIQITKSKSIEKRSSNKERNGIEDNLSEENNEDNSEYEESKIPDNTENLNRFKLEKSRSHYIPAKIDNDKISKLNHKINKMKSLDVNKKKRDKYVIKNF